MALPEKRDEMNRIDERAVRIDEQADHWVNECIEEHPRSEDRQHRQQREREEHHAHGHDFTKDIHPERYPRESLSRLEEGILEDDQVRHEHDRLPYSGPDVELRVEDSRNLSRTLMVLGSFLLIFAWVLLLWVGWDVRSGEIFFSSMCVVSIVVGMGLIAWGLVERQRVMHLRAPLTNPRGERIGRVGREHELREGDRAS